ncbi:MAG TPA: hypothetical protein VK172_12550 [Lentimicrobium sp.]|nr:hypothetical protein [Lentimicrobium sp.]
MNSSDNLVKNPTPVMEIIVRTALIAAAILIIPLVIMLTTDEMNWSVIDYIIVWLLLFGAGVTFRLLTRKKSRLTYRIGIGLAVLTGLFMMWVNLAVGIVGSGPNAANLMYAGILVIGMIGAIVSKFKPNGLANTLFIVATLNSMLCIFAVLMDKRAVGEDSTWQIIAFNCFFIVMWIASGLLIKTGDNLK